MPHLRTRPLLLLTAVSVLALTGCVSSQKALDSAEATPASAEAATQQAAMTSAAPGQHNQAAGYRDPMVTNVGGQQAPAADTTAASGMPPGSTQMQPANIGGMAMQSTRINANAMSIFSSQPALPQNNRTSTIVQPTDANAYAPVQGGLTTSRGGVFSAPPGQPQPNAQGDIPPQQQQQSSQNTGTAIAPSYQSASLATGSLPGGSTNALYAAPKQNLMGSLSGLLQKASLPGMTRVAPNGVHVQNAGVEVACFKPNLLNVIKTVETHFGKPVVVTSGYRDPEHNRMVGGAEESMHKSCDAADIKIDGVSKWDIASYIRSLPGRGGVGTYCHTDSVHLDTGNTRDWNWGCSAGHSARPSARAI